jgi:hypothetical protein
MDEISMPSEKRNFMAKYAAHEEFWRGNLEQGRTFRRIQRLLAS